MGFFVIRAASAAFVLACLSTAFSPSTQTNLAVYWGQGSGQQRLSHFCENTAIDIIPIAFLDIFPDQGAGGYPGTNFGNQCEDDYYTTPDGTKSQLLSNCQNIVQDIPYCQSLGKKIFLSIGGGYPINYEIKNDASAVAFANFVWGAFGPKKHAWTGPRPFGDIDVDGFDFDIESLITPAPADPSYQYRGYATMITRLRELYATELGKTYYISGAPQCQLPDVHLADAIQNAWFDFIFIQFYNTPQCSARAHFDHTYGSYGGPPTDISFAQWSQFVQTKSLNRDAKVYLGLPASPSATYDGYMYMKPAEVDSMVQNYQATYGNFGGIMLWEATHSDDNQICGSSYANIMKDHNVGNYIIDFFISDLFVFICCSVCASKGRWPMR
ncbi:MAG: hypothetical protein M1812_005674 [Candelaria pacifica]|nr:MAG: hypothetical protein M1812_005674 [Candelaria pacifica]